MTRINLVSTRAKMFTRRVQFYVWLSRWIDTMGKLP